MKQITYLILSFCLQLLTSNIGAQNIVVNKMKSNTYVITHVQDKAIIQNLPDTLPAVAQLNRVLSFKSPQGHDSLALLVSNIYEKNLSKYLRENSYKSEPSLSIYVNGAGNIFALELFSPFLVNDSVFMAFREQIMQQVHFRILDIGGLRDMPYVGSFGLMWLSLGSLVANYAFNDLADNGGFKNNFMLQDGAILSNGKLLLRGGGLRDISHPHGKVANDTSLNPQFITIAAKIKLQEFDDCVTAPIVYKPSALDTVSYCQYKLGVYYTYCGDEGHRFYFGCSINGQPKEVISPANQWVSGQWYIVAGIYDGAYLKLFVNGKQVSSISAPGRIDSFNTDLFIGKQKNSDYSIPAEIEWLRVYNRPLWDTEVTVLKNIN